VRKTLARDRPDNVDAAAASPQPP